MCSLAPSGDTIIQGDSGEALRCLPSSFFQMIYIDPPFGTGQVQQRGGLDYADAIEAVDEYISWIQPFIRRVHELLTPTGTLYLHLDWRMAAYVRVLVLDPIFGPRSFLNEIIWAYDFGGRATHKWPSKHDTIMVYVKDPKQYYFNSSEVDREPYMAPGLVGPEKAARGKLPTDVWWHTIVHTTGAEKTGYPTQKPEGIVRRMVLASSKPGDWCLDFFAGSGTLGAVAQKLGRHFVLVDNNPDATQIMKQRLQIAPSIHSS